MIRRWEPLLLVIRWAAPKPWRVARATRLGKGVFGRGLGSGPSESLSVVLVHHANTRRYRLRRGRSEGFPRTRLCKRRPAGMAKPSAKTEQVSSATERSGALDRSRRDNNHKECYGDVLMG